MTNRLNYCEVGRDRLNQQAAIAKWRYQRMIQSRRKSFQENNWLQKVRCGIYRKEKI